jgi:excisionase family DNA binding protein
MSDTLAQFDLLTLSEVAQVLHCSKAHVSNVVAGRVRGCSPIPAVRLGRRRLVCRSSLEAWIAENDRVAVSDNRKPVSWDHGRMSTSPEESRKSA